eukprot:GGOE01062201.1.p1 GENE.GGOE01062201.1~~GGOE01062201.1.p1  ORF type:complete len:728 (-),score=262.72 GGOE01062201.1:298-2274(-)
MSDSDVLVKSETGSGKTLAYTIPLVQRMAQDWQETPFKRDGGTRALILVPTRELAVQCLEVVSGVCRPFPHFVPGGIMGGEQRHKEKARLRHGVVTLVCTPGRLVDHLRTTKSFAVRALRYIVYDEADRILDMGFQKDISFLLDHLRSKGARVRKSVLASATLDLRVQHLAHVTLHDPILIGYDEKPSSAKDDSTTTAKGGREADPTPAEEAFANTEEDGFAKIDANAELDTNVTVPEGLRQHYIICPCKWRLPTLAGFLRWKLDAKMPNKIIIFLSNVDSVEFHYSLLSSVRVARTSSRLTEEEQQAKAERKRKAAEERRRRKKERLRAERRILQQLQGDQQEEDELEADIGDAETHEESFEVPDEEVENSVALDDSNSTLLVPFNLFRLHGNVDQLERVSVYKAFSQCERGVLLCTDVAARGVDFPGVTWIVQYDTPGEERNYIHRIGRTARIGNVGNSLLFLMPHEVKYTKLLRRHRLYLQQVKSEVVMFHMAQALGASDIGSAAPEMHSALCRTVMGSSALQRLARLGFQAFVRAYATHPKRLKPIFHPNELHLGHVASSFGLPAKPSEIESKEFHKSKLEEKKALIKRIVQKQRVPEGREKEEYIPAFIKKEEKRQKDLAVQNKKKKKRAAQLSSTSEFEAGLVLPTKRHRAE